MSLLVLKEFIMRSVAVGSRHKFKFKQEGKIRNFWLGGNLNDSFIIPLDCPTPDIPRKEEK